MISITDYIREFKHVFTAQKNLRPWEITQHVSSILIAHFSKLNQDYLIENGIAIHKSATIEPYVTLKGPIIIGPNCFVGANAYLRGGVYLAVRCSIGPSCEIKSSILFSKSSIAHFNFIGDSIIGTQVNFEAGSHVANHFNERFDKKIMIVENTNIINTEIEKFGALVGDFSKIGANAVLPPGTLLRPNSIVKRLELVNQCDTFNT